MYKILSAAGYSDGQIADLAGVTRVTVQRVRTGTWPYGHNLSYEGGQRVVGAVRKVRAVAADAQQELPLGEA